MKDKYVEHEFPRYTSAQLDPIHGNQFITEILTDAGEHVALVFSESVAKVLADRDAIVSKLCDMARAFEAADDKALTEFWYGKMKLSEAVAMLEFGRHVTTQAGSEMWLDKDSKGRDVLMIKLKSMGGAIVNNAVIASEHFTDGWDIAK